MKNEVIHSMNASLPLHFVCHFGPLPKSSNMNKHRCSWIPITIMIMNMWSNNIWNYHASRCCELDCKIACHEFGAPISWQHLLPWSSSSCLRIERQKVAKKAWKQNGADRAKRRHHSYCVTYKLFRHHARALRNHEFTAILNQKETPMAILCKSSTGARLTPNVQSRTFASGELNTGAAIRKVDTLSYHSAHATNQLMALIG